ncbi:MAG: DUF3109 family protein [Chitinophagaceae bacterium]|nr:MAG: DUF3109 family protein [Chitinophagaceae bacterium]
MIAIDNVLISEDVVSKQFVCDLSKCKGGCCEDGDAGAPLEKEELDHINEVYETVKPYLTAEGIKWIERHGRYVYDVEFGWVTPTIDNKLCVYAFRDEKNVIKCGIEQAYRDGKITWKKPISCHFYPIISETGKKGAFDRMNYEPRETLCKPACSLGEKLKVPVYQFLKEPIIRKYGEDFYNALDQVAKDYFETAKK